MTTFSECFCNAEDSALRVLVDAYGFDRAERTVVDDGSLGTFASVRYVAAETAGCSTPPGWSVRLSVAPFRLELGVDVADELEQVYQLEELHQLAGAGAFPRGTHRLTEAAHDRAMLQAEFARLVGILEACGRRFFDGDRCLWTELAAQRKRHEQEASDSTALARSEHAVQRQDWRRVVELLGPMTARLSKAASARLAYARKQVQRAN